MSISAWQEVKDDQGRTYYYNSETQETSWENPAAQSAGTWQTFTTEDGKEYYYNEATGATTWDKPAELLKGEKISVEQDDAKIDTRASYDVSPDTRDMSDLDRKLASEPLLDSILVNLKSLSDKEEAKIRFQTMLKEGCVDSTWSFEKVIKTFIKNKSYWAIDDAVQRRKIYEDYLVSKLERESSSKTDMIEEFKKSFVREIQAYLSQGKITHETRWISTKNLLIKNQNPVFEHSILPDAELEKLFVECTEKLRLQKKKVLHEMKTQALQELEGYLLQVTSSKENENLTWDKLYKRLQSDARFLANKHFQVLTKVDILDLYSNKIYPHLIEKIRVETAKIEEENSRADRRARDAFKALLSRMVIFPHTKFHNILPEIENEDEYIELCGRNGSTPLELFWDITEEKIQQQKVKKDLIEHSIRTFIDQSPNGPEYETVLKSFESFCAILKSIKDESLNNLNLFNVEGTDELNMIHEKLRSESKARKNQEISAFERRLKGAVYELANWIAKNRDLVDSSVVLFKERKPHAFEGVEVVEVVEGPEGVNRAEESEDNHNVIKRAIILVSDREAVLKSDFIDPHVWQEKFSNVEAFSILADSITRFYNNDPIKAEQSLRVNLLVCLKEVSSLITSALHKKRSAPDPFQRDVKRTKPEGEKKPLLMNY